MYIFEALIRVENFYYIAYTYRKFKISYKSPRNQLLGVTFKMGLYVRDGLGKYHDGQHQLVFYFDHADH